MISLFLFELLSVWMKISLEKKNIAGATLIFVSIDATHVWCELIRYMNGLCYVFVFFFAENKFLFFETTQIALGSNIICISHFFDKQNWNNQLSFAHTRAAYEESDRRAFKRVRHKCVRKRVFYHLT